jgi:hypothetical protein
MAASRDSVEVGPAETIMANLEEDQVVEIGYHPERSTIRTTTYPQQTPKRIRITHDGGLETLFSAPQSYTLEEQNDEPPPEQYYDQSADDLDKENSKTKNTNRLAMIVTLILCCLLILIGIVVAMVVAFRDPKYKDPPAIEKVVEEAPTNPPTVIPTTPTRLQLLLDILGPGLVEGDEGYPNHPTAVEAVLWLAEQDPEPLPVDGSIPPHVLQERYALAMLYFSTTTTTTNDNTVKGGGWDRSDNFLSGQSICTWYGVNCTTATTTAATKTLSWEEEYPSVTHIELGGSLTYWDVTSLDRTSFSLAPNNTSLFSIVRVHAVKKLRHEEGNDAFTGNGLQGSLPIALSTLSNLKTLHLNRNSISGTLPSEFGTLTNLESLQLGSLTHNGYVGSTFVVGIRQHQLAFHSRIVVFGRWSKCWLYVAGLTATVEIRAPWS